MRGPGSGLAQSIQLIVTVPLSIQGLRKNHLLEIDNDLSVVRKFKKIVTDELSRRFDPTCSLLLKVFRCMQPF